MEITFPEVEYTFPILLIRRLSLNWQVRQNLSHIANLIKTLTLYCDSLYHKTSQSAVSKQIRDAEGLWESRLLLN